VAALAAAPANGWGQTPASSDAVEVVVTLKAPPLAEALVRTRTLTYSSFASPHRLLLASAASRTYLARLAQAQRVVAHRVQTAIPGARARWRYRVVLDGLAVVVPRRALARLADVPGIERVWPNATYHPLLDRTPQLIGAPTLWGPTLATAGQGMKIGIIDDGIDQTHPFFNPAGYAYPAGFPKGQTSYTTPKVIVARAFAPANSTYAPARLPFDAQQSEHGTHVAGIAAGDNGTVTRSGLVISGIAPRAYLGNYKALGTPSEFGLNGNSAELAAAVEAAVRDGMDVINLSLGETDMEPSRDIVVRALDAAADAGIVSTVAAGNSGDLGPGSIDSPGTATKAIAAAASTGGHDSVETDTPTDFSSIGPAPYSLAFKPDVTAPGDGVVSSIPAASYAAFSGTSMAAPHVAGAAALLRQRHPTWTPAQVKSALVTTGAPIRSGGEVSPLREGGGRIDLPHADNPHIFAAPTSLAFGLRKPRTTVTRSVTLTDAGGGAGSWSVSTTNALVTVPAEVTVPGRLAVRLALPRQTAEATMSGFVVLTRAGESRRIPYWFRTERPRLPRDPHATLARPGTFAADTRHGSANVTSYRFPDVPAGRGGFPVRLRGPELVYRIRVRRLYANLGVAVLAHGRGVDVEPRVVRADDENRLAGEVALPFDANPYRASYGKHRPVVGALFPSRGTYDLVFDTPRPAQAGRFTFRFWLGDTTPPAVGVLGVRKGRLEVAVTDRGSGVDPAALTARIDGTEHGISYGRGIARVSLAGVARGSHTVVFSAADYQEAKNNENVPGILPNTRKVQRTFVLR
jgi:subtilisin family serine protease